MRGRGLLVGAVALVASALGGEVATAAPTPVATTPSWTDLLDREAIGAAAWTRAHPTWDGRGVVVAVLDTGVDPSLAGLSALPDGSGPKVIETRDFSGEGEVELAPARALVEGGVPVLRVDGDDGGVVRGADRLTAKPREGSGYQLGFFGEAALRGSQVTDLDRDGATRGRFAVLGFERDDGVPVAVVDTDGDGDVSDEDVRASYAVDPRWFAFAARSGDPRDNRAPVAVTLHVDPGARRVELHFDDGGHGSHCAGIAAGYRVSGKDGFDGIAPGARVMSLKIGHNALSGGATTAGSMAKAIRFAAAWANEHQQPVVINMSYGIGNEREGLGDIDKILDDALAGSPWLVAALSAGNSGPGLSNVGMPGSATLAWASAAMLPERQARTLYGGNTKGRKVFSFSSRGGELWKPDGLAPGVAWATVPAFETSSVKAGTSMASPQAAGAFALLASAAVTEKLPWTSGLARRAMKAGARPIAGYGPLDQGAGLIDVAGAWEAFKREARDPGAALVAGWKVRTPVPSRPGRKGSASYWRVGRWLPEPTEALSFEIAPLLYTTAPEQARQDHLDTFTLSADVGWLDVDRTTLALRGTEPATVAVRLDADALGGKPGVHAGRVRAVRAGGGPAFDLPVVVVVPEAMGEDGWSRRFSGTVAPGDVVRYFVAAPPGGTAMSAHLAVRGSYGRAWIFAFDPEGRERGELAHVASTDEQTSADFVVGGRDLAPGIWELDVYAGYAARGPAAYDLDVTFRALAAPDALAYTVGDGGGVSSDLTLTNGLELPFRGALDASVIGIERTKKVEVKGSKTSVPVVVGDDYAGVDVTLELDEATWDRMTDVAVQVLDAGGAIVDSQGLGQRRMTFPIDRGPGRYTLEIIGGLAEPPTGPKAGARWSFELGERQRRSSPRALSVDLPTGMSKATLYPGVPTTFDLSSAASLPELPEGFEHVASVTLTAVDGTVWTTLELPLRRKE